MRWWATHKANLSTWSSVQTDMIQKFVPLPKFECLNISGNKTNKFMAV